MMKKILSLFTALTLSVGLWANNIYYTATGFITIPDDDAFDMPTQFQSFDDKKGTGVIGFFENVTKINDNAFKDRTPLLTITLPNTIVYIGNAAFSGCTSLNTFTVPFAVTEIGNNTFDGCVSLTSFTFEGTACQEAIGENAFRGVGSVEKPATLVLPEDWLYKNAPANSSTPWYGGYFTSNIYADNEATDKQAAIDAITAIVGEYTTTSPYLQSLLAEEITNINSAVNRPQVNEKKQAASDRLQLAVSSYTASKTEVLGEMGTPCVGCHAVEVKKGDKSITLYAPTGVNYKTIEN